MGYLNADSRSLLRRTKLWGEGLVEGAALEDGVIWVDVRMQPDEQLITAELAPLCPGFFRLPKEGEEVLVGFIDADRTQGYVVGHTGPGSITGGAESDVLYVWAPDGERVVIQATGAGEVQVLAPRVMTKADQIVEDSVDVRLGSPNASDNVVLQSLMKAEFQKFLTKNYRLHQHMQVMPLIPAGSAPTLPGAPVDALAASGLGAIGASNVKGK